MKTMGILGSFCCLCALPLQHDHFVLCPSPDSATDLKVYRGSEPDGGHDWQPGEHPFPFGPEHEWLAQAVALARFEDDPPLLAGTVTDGRLIDPEGAHSVAVFTGYHDYAAFHRVCWQRMGSPRTAGDAVYSVLDEERRTLRGIGTYDWALLASYHEQLFDVFSLARDGRGWMLADPRGTTPAAAHSKARIEAALRSAKRRLTPEERPDLATVPDVLLEDCDWYAQANSDRQGNRAQVIRSRQGVRPDLDRTGYDDLVWMMTEYDGGTHLSQANLDAATQLEMAIKQVIERDYAGILVAGMVTGNSAQYVLQAKDSAEALRRIEMLPEARVPARVQYDREVDPAWCSTFDLLWGRGRTS